MTLRNFLTYWCAHRLAIVLFFVTGIILAFFSQLFGGTIWQTIAIIFSYCVIFFVSGYNTWGNGGFHVEDLVEHLATIITAAVALGIICFFLKTSFAAFFVVLASIIVFYIYSGLLFHYIVCESDL